MAKDLINITRTTKYPLDAFIFVQRGLEYTVQRTYGPLEDETEQPGPETPSGACAKRVERHISGRQLCMGLRDFAIEQYGLLARTVMRRWRINSCEDFGHIVFAMVDAGLMNKTEDDSIRDFTDVYDFEAAFAPQLELSKKH